jgi:hypothetical protein
VGKSRRGNREFTREQKLVHENKRLKKELAQLRKQLARIDLDRYDTVREMIQEHYQEEKAQQGLEILENLKKTWACKECADGHLEIFLYNKVGTTWYYRICSNAPKCKNRTLAQKYSPEVKGIIKNT